MAKCRDSNSKWLAQKSGLKQQTYVTALQNETFNKKYYVICGDHTWGPIGAAALSSCES
jgi:hypothetical protein